jgi:hypothetical protein
MNPTQQRAIVKRIAVELFMKERDIWIQRCTSAITASVAADLIDKWDWTPEQVSKLLESSDSNFQNMLDKFVSIDDFYEWLEEKHINIKH